MLIIGKYMFHNSQSLSMRVLVKYEVTFHVQWDDRFCVYVFFWFST